MSEYQYYEFLAVDAPLTKREMGELRAISTRAEITRTHFSNEYSYGDLKADPAKLLERYFDVHVYLANWGTRRLSMRLPHDAVSLDEVAPYCVEGGVAVRRGKRHLLLDLWSESEEDEDWWEARGWTASLAMVRGDLLRGDLRPLYLAWLGSLENAEVEIDDDALAPPVPPGLETLPGPLRTLAEFLRVDEHLLAAATEARPAEPSEPEGLSEWVDRLAPSERTALPVRVAQGEHAQVSAALARRFKASSRGATRVPAEPRRTVGQLRARADEIRTARYRKKARKAAAARKRREAAAAAARTKQLDLLAGRKPQAWKDVENLISLRQQAGYVKAVALLLDLRDVAARDGDEPRFTTRLAALRARHARKKTFVARLNKAGLPKERP